MLFCENETDDFANVLASIDGFALGLGVSPLSIDESSISSVLVGMRNDFPAQGGTAKASPFKKAAHFLCYFVSEAPVRTPFGPEIVGPDISRISNHQNSMVGLSIVFDALHNAKINRDDAAIVLSNKISVSRHSYIDIVQACSSIPPSSHFHIVSVLLEQICYRANPNASYKICT